MFATMKLAFCLSVIVGSFLEVKGAGDDTEANVRAQTPGLLNLLNPFQNKQPIKESTSNGNINSDPLGLQNLLGGLNILNGTSNNNPLQSALSTGGEAKLFIVASQGLVIPLPGLQNGLTNLLPNMPGLPKLPLVS